MPANPSTASLDATLRDFVAGQNVFGRYTLTKILGRGGMGIVWLAHDDELDRDVALKFLPEIIVHDRAVVADLKRETKRALELTHENIIRIHDFVHDSISACISMEFIDGDTLSNLRSDKATRIFEPDELKPWLRELCNALDYAHNRARIIHRDLKPSNLMISKRGQLKIADFGIARSLSESVSVLTHSQSASGTLVYMSPQQLDGHRGTHLDDIYSLGATLYELLTSKPPFYSGDISRQIHERIPPSMAQRRNDLDIEANPVPKTWEETVAACLAKDPTQRPQSVMELGSRLGVTVRPEPVRDDHPQVALTDNSEKSKPASFATPHAKIVRNRSLLILAALVVIGVGIWFGVKSWETPKHFPIADPIARSSKEIARCEKYRATWTPQGTIWILKQPWDELLTTFSTQPLVAGTINAVFSGDGRYFAYGDGTASLGITIYLFRLNEEGKAEEIRLVGDNQSPWEFANIPSQILIEKMQLPGKGEFGHTYCTPISISVEPLTLTFDLLADYYSPGPGTIKIQKATKFNYRLDTHAFEIVGPLPLENKTENKSQIVPEQSPASPMSPGRKGSRPTKISLTAPVNGKTKFISISPGYFVTFDTKPKRQAVYLWPDNISSHRMGPFMAPYVPIPGGNFSAIAFTSATGQPIQMQEVVCPPGSFDGSEPPTDSESADGEPTHSDAEKPSPAAASKKLFAGTWEGTIRMSLNGKVTDSTDKMRLTFNDAETEATTQASLTTGWVRKAARTLVLPYQGGTGQYTVTVRSDGKTADFVATIQNGFWKGVLHKQ